MKILKYPLETAPDQMIEMPEGAEVLHVAAQLENPMIWAKVDPNAKKIRRRFILVATGQEFPEKLFPHYVGTFLLHGGGLVFHVYTDRVEYPVDESAGSSR